MDGSVMPFLIVVASLAAFQWWMYRLGGRRMQSPLWYAFTTTAAAALFLISGSVGYTPPEGPAVVCRCAVVGRRHLVASRRRSRVRASGGVLLAQSDPRH